MFAKIKFLRIAPKKLERVIKLVKEKDVVDAVETLKNLPHRSAKILLKAVNSAISNAENNFNESAEDLYFDEIYVSEGPVLKRIRPRAMGRAYLIRKRTSHITITLGKYS